MAGGSPRHNVLCSRVNMALLGGLDPKGCYVFSSDQKVALSGDRYVYPDLSAICGAIALEAGTNDVITNPQVVVEVLSSSTEPYDRGLKWEGYQRIPSLSDYVLVSQSEPRMEHFLRERNGAWVYRAAGPGERVVLGGGTVLDVDAIFSGAFDIAGE